MRVVLSDFPAILTLSAIMLASNPLLAAELTEPGGEGFQFHGFLSQGLIATSGNNFLVKSKLGSFDFTEAGLNFTKSLTDKCRTGVQLFVQRLGSGTDLNPKLDWAYFDYRASNLFGLRFGRVKQPIGLYNEIIDVEPARTPILLPQSVYPMQNRNYFLAQDGVEVYGYLGSGAAGALAYRLYGGTVPVPITNTPGNFYQIQRFDTPFLLGTRLIWHTPIEGLKVAQTLQAMRFDASVLAGTTPVSVKLPFSTWLSSIEYSSGELVLSAEYMRRYIRIADSSDPALLPNSLTISQGGYLMGTYRVSDWFEPGLYYSVTFPNLNSTSGRENHLHDIAATLRFDINQFWIVKAEGHFMRGTGGLNTALNDGTPLSRLEETWGAYLLKTTAYF
jgi:hypothetical protein